MSYTILPTRLAWYECNKINCDSFMGQLVRCNCKLHTFRVTYSSYTFFSFPFTHLPLYFTLKTVQQHPDSGSMSHISKFISINECNIAILLLLNRGKEEMEKNDEEKTNQQTKLRVTCCWYISRCNCRSHLIEHMFCCCFGSYIFKM